MTTTATRPETVADIGAGLREQTADWLSSRLDDDDAVSTIRGMLATVDGCEEPQSHRLEKYLESDDEL
jgi:hypothetical protein